jgi:hypothetical protein
LTARRAAAAGVIALGGCASYWSTYVPTAATVIPHRGSTVVTIATNSQRLKMHHESAHGSFAGDPGGGTAIVGSDTVVVAYRYLDLRACKDLSRWRGPAGTEPDGSDVPLDQRGLFGPVRFHASGDQSDLMATDTATGVSWTVARSFQRRIASVTAVPAARRVVVADELGAIFVYDVDARRFIDCAGR